VLAVVSAASLSAVALQASPVQADGSTWVLPLRVDGNRITDSSTADPHAGPTVVLNGIHRDGAQIDPVSTGIAPRFPTDGEVSWITTGRTGSWNANVVRVPVSAPLWTGACPSVYSTAPWTPAPSQYRASVDATISSITSRGAIALLDLHTVAPKCVQIGRHTMPDQGAVDFWKDASVHYAGNPLVAFELYNEPHYVTQDVWLNGTADESVTDCDPHAGATHKASDVDPVVSSTVQRAGIIVKLTDKQKYDNCTSDSNTVHWQAIGMQALYDVVVQRAPGHLVVVDGPDWANTTPAQLLSTTADGAVYAFHPYVCPSPDACSATPTANSGLIQGWKSFSAPTGRNVPILVSEVGWPVYKNDGSGPYRDGRQFYVDTIQQLAGVGIIGFAFDGSSRGAYDMITSTSTCQATAGSVCQPNTTAEPLFTFMQGQPHA
jgi:hypothetical protein